MVRVSIYWKLFGAFGVVIVATMFTVWLVVGPRVEAHALREIEHSLRVRTAIVIEELPPGTFREPPPAGLDAWIDRLGQASDTRYTIVREPGVVIADSERDPSTMEDHGRRPEVEKARETHEPATARRDSRTLGEKLLYLAVPIVEDGTVIGFVRASIPLTLVTERQRSLRENVLIGAAVAALVSALIALVISRVFTRPLAEMRSVAMDFADGHYERRLHVGSHDEIGELAEAIQRMAVQLKERLAELTREGNELRAILGSMLEGVVAVDNEERIVHMNQVAANLVGTSREESLGQRLWEVARIEAVGDTIAAVLTDAREHKREVRIARERGDRILELIASPLKSTGGGVAGAVLVLHDVTELRRLEIVRRDFVVNVSHELKTPLTAIRGFVETLIDDPDIEPETGRRFLGRVKDQVLRLSTLVSDLLVLSRVESEEEALERRPVDVRGAVRESARRLSPEATGRDLELVVETPDDPVVVLGDEESLRQVVDNLLDNACKYTPDQGRVRVALFADGNEAIIEVEDTGIGIEPKDLDRIFERFYRVDKARSRELGGTGLGLAIVKHIASAHGGRVAVESAAGRGSVFRVSLPLYGI